MLIVYISIVALCTQMAAQLHGGTSSSAMLTMIPEAYIAFTLREVLIQY